MYALLFGIIFQTNAALAGIRIIEPTEGQIFYSGEEITIVAESTEGDVLTSVGFVTEDWLSKTDTPPFTATLVTPV